MYFFKLILLTVIEPITYFVLTQPFLRAIYNFSYLKEVTIRTCPNISSRVLFIPLF